LGPRKRAATPESLDPWSTTAVTAMKDSFAEFLSRLRADDNAARELFQRFAC
jgi:hypothetical protein